MLSFRTLVPRFRTRQAIKFGKYLVSIFFTGEERAQKTTSAEPYFLTLILLGPSVD